ncbi:MAG: Hsp20/alpha crystallin family protein [Halobacteriaceae archaeon]
MSHRDRRVTRVSRRFLDAVLENLGRVAGQVQERRPLSWDLLESEERFLIVVDAPGVDRGDIDVRVVEDTIQVTVDRFREYREGFTMRFPGRGLSLHGSIDLPATAAVDPASASAELHDDGTLHISVPKREGTTVPVDAADTDAGED